MKICMIGKYPPIEGGVSMQNYWLCRSMAERGHQVFVVTNAEEVEASFRIYLEPEDRRWLEPQCEAGFVQVKNTELPTSNYNHIPYGNPFVTKLASLALETIRTHQCQLIDASYLEPYSLAAYLASQWTGIPYIIRPAGSDINRLMNIEQLRPTYTEILKTARFVISKPPVEKTLVKLGVDRRKLWPAFPFWLPKKYFNPLVDSLGINQFLASISMNNVDYGKKILQWRTDPLDLSLPIIGLYGKVGSIKGSIDLVYTLGHLKQKGIKFNFVCLSHGWMNAEETFRQRIKEVGIEPETRILPFLPHWRIPSFIRACTAVCYLERGFPITSHRSPIPMEVLSCGACLILSEEVTHKQLFKEKMISGQNFLLVHNPQDIEELAITLEEVIQNPEFAREIGAKAAFLAKSFGDIDETVDMYENLIEKAIFQEDGVLY